MRYLYRLNLLRSLFLLCFLLQGFFAVCSTKSDGQNVSSNYKTHEKNGKLAIFSIKDKKRLTDYIFDEVYESPSIAPKRHEYSSLITTFPRYGLTLVKKDGAFAYLNEEFKEFLPFGTYDSIIPMNYYGYSMVRKGTKWGVIDSKCILITPLIYDMISQTPRISYENDFNSFLARLENKYRILNRFAIWTLQLEFDTVEIYPENFYFAHLGDKRYLINNDCEVLSNQYSAVYDIRNGFIVKKDKRMGVIDYKNELEIPFDFDSIYSPHLEPYFFAFKQGKGGVIDEKGKTIVPFDYEYIGEAWEDNSKDVVKHLIVQKNKKMGTISLNNIVAIPIEFDDVSGWIEYGPGAHFVMKNGKYGMMSYVGEVLIPVIYDKLDYIDNSLIECKKNDKYGVITIKNEEILPCVNDSLIIDYTFLFKVDNKKDKLIVKNNGVWKYYDLKGKLLRSNVPDEEVKRRK